VPGFARERLRVLGIAALITIAAGVGLLLDARARAASGEAAEARTERIARATGLSDLALSTSSTWLRHPHLAPPGAGAADAPLGLDVDPAGAIVPRGTP
jgi:hypothetical protein